jgi:hypothetical protein
MTDSTTATKENLMARTTRLALRKLDTIAIRAAYTGEGNGR